MITEKAVAQKCDFCDRAAVYDGKTKLGPWAFMCETHRQLLGVESPLYVHRLDGVVPKKRCTVCGEEKQLKDFYSYTDHSGVLRYRSECKVCNLHRKQTTYQKRKEKA